MKHIVKTEAEWLELRKSYITASSAAVLVGADPYSSPKSLTTPSDFHGNAYTVIGQVLEPVVVDITNRVLGSHFRLYETSEGWKEFYTEGYFGATPDAYMEDTEGKRLLLECKTTRPKTYLKYSAVPPSKYIIQLLVQMICTDIKKGLLAILSTNLTQETEKLNFPITIFRVWTNEELCNILKEEAHRFKTSESFRVNSKVKQRVKILLTLAYERIK